LGLSFLLKEDYPRLTDTERINFAGEINQTSIKIFQMLENLLAWARTQTNQIEYNPEYINLSEFAEELYENTITQAHPKDIFLSFDVRRQHQVYADTLMLETILKNLISNAIKFTPRGGAVRVKSELEPESHFVKISVFDTGIGLTQEEQGKLFHIDQHLRKTGTEGEEGSGLGLLVCQEFVRKHGGQIGVNSEPGEGSHFWVTLPTSDRT
ncbi:MAG: ATP-binding protein, partial [Desulfofustis sp.]